ncbi:hypothetical protein BS17DRAFT_381266 [Gyrodon lividus]|nr:hypothetical protein BS17DRAFT_381266 [Gyrodon lividus]
MSLAISEVAGLQTTKYSNVAGLAILIFDFVITIEDEVQWVWGRSWDATRVIFTMSRYLPFLGMGMTAYSALRSSSEPCSPGLEENVLHTIGIIAAELLLVLRTYAFWQGNKRLLYGLLTYGVATVGAAVAIIVSPNQLIPGGQASPGCVLEASRNGAFVYALLLLYEIVILCLTAYKRFHDYRGVRMSTVRTIYRDGMFYIVCIISITLANVILDFAFPLQYSDLLDIAQIALHSVLASRIMFNLRRSAHDLQSGGMTHLCEPFTGCVCDDYLS